MERFEVSLKGPMAFETTALVIAKLAWPGRSKEALQGWERLYMTMCAWLVRERVADDPTWGSQPQWIRPDYGCRAEADMKRDLKTFGRRLRDRVLAGDMAIPFLIEAESGRTPELPRGVQRLSRNQLAERAVTNIGGVDVSHVLRHVWRPSLPVLHLCTAWATLQQEAVRANGSAPDFLKSMKDTAFMERLLLRANIHAALIVRSRLGLTLDDLTLINLAD